MSVDENLSITPNEKYAKFFAQFAEINSLDITHWKVPHLIGFFCKLYYDKYAVGYQFKFNTPTPPKCFEVFQMKRLGAILSTDPKIIHEYIDWIFTKKVPELKRRFTSISFLTRENFVNEYKWKVLTSDKNELHLDRTTPLPEKFKEALLPIASNFSTMNTYGDLSFLVQYLSGANGVAPNTEEQNVFNKLIELGLDLQLLNKVV